MSRFPALERFILRTIKEEGEARPPMHPRVAQEYWWQAASRLQSLGEVRADQFEAVVRRAS